MKDFEYFKINEYEDYILLTSNRDVYFLYDEIYKKLANNENKTILVDMFYRNGFSFNRFMEIVFKKDQEPFSRIINIRMISDDIKNNSREFFKSNTELLNNSLLSKNVKSFILSSC